MNAKRILISLFALLIVSSGVFGGAAPVQAAPDMPLSGHFVVNSLADNTTYNDVLTLSGSASPADLGSSTQVELYQGAFDPSGFGEGKTYLGSATADANGHWTVTLPGSDPSCYAAFQTITTLLTGDSTSSEFGPNSCQVFVPLIVK